MTTQDQKETIGDLVIRRDQRKKEIVCLDSKIKDAIDQIKVMLNLFDEAGELQSYASYEEVSQWKSEKETAEQDKKEIEGRLRNYGIEL